jgi:hypothetical protein
MPETINTDLLPTTDPVESQRALFDLAEVEGFGALSLRERLFCEALTLGYSQRAAARAAGIKGEDDAVDVQASRLAHKPSVRRFLGQCWTKSGASIEETLRQAARVQARALNDYEQASHREGRAAAMREWQAASALIASIHGRLGIRIEGQVNHAHAHIHGQAPEAMPAAALGFFAQLRRSVITERVAATAGADNTAAA